MDSMIPVRVVRPVHSQLWAYWPICAVLLLCGCSSVPPSSPSAEPREQETFVLARITPEQGETVLSGLGLGAVTRESEPNALLVSGSPSEIERARIVLELVDADEPFVVESLAPAAMVRTLPSNDQIARAVGNLTIGTFAVPPRPDQTTRAIVDVHAESVVAIVPARLWPDVRAIIEFGPDATRASKGSPPEPGREGDHAQAVSKGSQADTGSEQSQSTTASATNEEEPLTPTPKPPPAQMMEVDKPTAQAAQTQQPSASDDARTSTEQTRGAESAPARLEAPAPMEPPQEMGTSRGVLRPSGRSTRPAPAVDAAPTMSFPNGSDVLELSLPERIELVQLLDLAAEYLHLDCVYDAERIGNQMITLKLRSKLRSEMQVKDLYSLLETVLKFKGLVMARHEGNLVTIVPSAEALEIDPRLVDPNNRAIQAGDMVVTRVFELRYVEVASITNLLQNMKLSVAVSPLPETQTLFVTCYAHRMARIEQLVDMIDRPGRPREFRFRQLKYTMAATLTRKVLSLAGELEGIAISIGSTDTRAGRGTRSPGQPQAAQGAAGPAVYLDTDERTNRMLMIGFSEQLETVEGLIDTLDIPQQDLRTLKVWDIEHVEARTVVDKLQQLGIIDKGGGAASRGAKTASTATGGAETVPGEEPQVILLEATNSLLVHATDEQHGQIRMIIDYVDISPEDLRVLEVYRIRYVDADDVARKLQQMQLIGQVALSTAVASGTSKGDRAPVAPAEMTNTSEAILVGNPQVVVLEVTNSLLINATRQQHERIKAVIEHVDMETPRETLPYEIYFLENQEPEQLAEVLGKLIQETITDPEGKIEKTIPRIDEAVTIIPDKSTFSLIVHASRKNQDWLANLIEKLDKRRPQVLIDATLVEVTEAESFTYDLNLIQSFPDLTATSGLTGQITEGVTSADILDRLAASGRDQFIDLQSDRGKFTGFYGDEDIHILLQAMQSKNYGRVLAKPKLLVNDNGAGTIKTMDTTYVPIASSIPVSTGGGENATLVQTELQYESYEAGIMLDITPHISEGNLLRLDIVLTRSDFLETEDPERPPNTRSNEVTTTVTVPDGSTIILGGLLKANQNKGGTKVPILGDIPILGGLFRSINNRDTQSKLYIFVKAEIIRPAGVLAQGMDDLKAISERNRIAFEEHEAQFQHYEDWPGIKPAPVQPEKVLEAD